MPDARLAERQRQLADVALLGLEAEAVLADGGVLDSRLGERDLQRTRVVGGAQPVAGSALAAQVGERALVDDAPGVDDRDPVAQLLHLGQLVAGEQHRDPFVGETADQRAHVAHPGRVEAGRGLVEDQQARAAQQRGGDPEPLAHAVRVAADLVLGAGAELDDVEHLVDPRGGTARGPSTVQRGEQFEVLACAEIGVEARRLDEARDALQGAGALAHRVASEQLDGALGGRDQAERHAQRGRLAGAVRAEEAVHVAGVDVQVDVVDREDVVVALDQSARPYRRRCRRSR